MALFKISKGLAANLAKNVPNAKEGFAYFTSDDGKFYIDTAGDGTTATPAVVGTNRIPLNAYASDVLKAGEMSTTDGIVYPILAFKITDTAKNLVEAKYGKIGFKNGTLVIPDNASNNELLISNSTNGSAIKIENTSTNGYGIEITGSGKGIKVAADPVDDLELTTKRYVDTIAANKQDKITADGILQGDGEGNITVADNIEVSLVSIDKSTVGLGNVDNTSDLDKPISTATQTALNNKAAKSALNNYLPLAGGTMTGNIAMSSKKITGLATPSADADAANKAYVDKIISANDAMVFKGVIGPDTELPATHETGWTYRVNEAGTYAGNKCEIGDLIICIKDSTPTGQNSSDWTVVQTNIDGAVIGPTSAEDNHIAIFDGATGKVIKDSGITLDDKQDKITANGILKGDGTGNISSAEELSLQAGNAVNITESGSNITIGVAEDTFIKKSGDTMVGNLTLNKNLILTSNMYGNAAPTSGTTGSLFFAQDTSDSDFLPLSGGTLSGDLTLNEKLLITDKMFGATKPSNPVEGQIFFQENDGSLTLPAGGSAGQYLVKNSANDSDASWKTLPAYLPLTGGTLSNVLSIKSASAYPGFTLYESGPTENYVKLQYTTDSIVLYENKNKNNIIKYTPSTKILYFNGSSTARVTSSGQIYGAVWNDYAEFREGDTIEAGKCVVEVGDDTLKLSSERMQPGANITSDTFGFAIGETDKCKTPIAVSGRVLAYGYEDREEFKKNIGRPVCSGPNGTVSIMTDEEYKEKGYCAIGTISAIPDYEEWGSGNVKVDGRIWIKV